MMLAGGARRLAALYGVRPGTRAVVATIGDRGLDAALALREAGVEIGGVADLRDAAPAARAAGAAARERGARDAGATVLEARGRSERRAAS